MRIDSKCTICDYTAKTIVGLVSHITKKHKISSKYYYDKYIKFEGKGVCKNCNKETIFRGFRYNEFCSNSCSTKFLRSIPEIKQKYIEGSKRMAKEERNKGLFKKGVSSWSLGKKFSEQRCVHISEAQKGRKGNRLGDYKIERKTVLCENCNKEFKRKVNIIGNHIFCSRECAFEWRKTDIYKNEQSVRFKGQKKVIYENRFCKCGCGHGREVRIKSNWQYKKGHQVGMLRKGKNYQEIYGFDKSKRIREQISLKRCDFLLKHDFKSNSKFKTGYFYSKKNDRNLYYMSSYELLAFQILESLVTVKSYKTQFIKIPYIFENVTHFYIVDLYIEYTDGQKQLIEIKPKNKLTDIRTRIKLNSAIEYSKLNNMPFTIWTEIDLKNMITKG